MHQFAEALTEHGLKILSKLPRFCVKILNNKIKAIDSSYSMYVFIDDYEKEVQSLLNLRHFVTVQKNKVENKLEETHKRTV